MVDPRTDIDKGPILPPTTRDNLRCLFTLDVHETQVGSTRRDKVHGSLVCFSVCRSENGKSRLLHQLYTVYVGSIVFCILTLTYETVHYI